MNSHMNGLRAIPAQQQTTFVTETLGWLLFGIASYRARLFPRFASALVILGALLHFVGPSWIFRE